MAVLRASLCLSSFSSRRSFSSARFRSSISVDEGIPAGYSARCVAHGVGASLEPPIDTIGPAIAEFIFKGDSGCHRMRKICDHARQVIRMNRIVGPPGLQFIEGLAEILQELSVGKFDLAGRIQGVHLSRNTVENLAKIGFTRLQTSPRPACGHRYLCLYRTI